VTPPPPIELRGATFGYGDQPVVHHADLRITAGEVVAVLGPNGCGKSTLVKGALGVAALFSGEVRLFGEPLASFGERWRVGYVPQRLRAGGGIPVTVRESVAAGRVPRMRPFARRTHADAEAVATALQVVGLTDRRDDRLSTLSGGQQRRALIARALAAEAEALVLDEPMAGVDHAHQHLLADTLHVLVEHGRTVIVILHELGPLEPLITRVVAMDEGRITYDGAPRRADVHLHELEAHPHDAAEDRPRRLEGLPGGS
jgi:zinc transport system ATP-binding protein